MAFDGPESLPHVYVPKMNNYRDSTGTLVRAGGLTATGGFSTSIVGYSRLALNLYRTDDGAADGDADTLISVYQSYRWSVGVADVPSWTFTLPADEPHLTRCFGPFTGLYFTVVVEYAGAVDGVYNGYQITANFSSS